MSERFFLPQPLDAPELQLPGPEAHHLSHVLRIGPGSQVILFDGAGCEIDAMVVSATKRSVCLRPTSSIRRTGTAAIPVTLAVAPPKGDRFRWLVEKATELDMVRLVPLQTHRSVVDPRDGKLDKLRQTVIAACKQSGRNHLMDISSPIPFTSFLDSGTPENGLVVLHPGAETLAAIDLASHSPNGVTLLIGPEGGFTDDELDEALQRGARQASLGRTILRTETAAIAAAAIMSALSTPLTSLE